MLNLFKYRFFWEGLIIACVVIGIYLRNEWKSSADYKPIAKIMGIGFIVIALISVFVS